MESKIYLEKIIADLKFRAEKWKLWTADFLDRRIIDYRSHERMKVTSMDGKFLDEPGSERSWWWKINDLPSCEKENHAPVKLLPNCVRYQGENNKLSWLSALFGIIRRNSRQGGRMVGWFNGQRNGFLRYIFKLMGIYRDKEYSKGYWRVAKNLQKNEVYQVACINYVAAGWEKKFSDKYLSKIIEEVKRLVTERPVAIDYKRVYIPKGNGKVRPLGVPTLSWRIYLHMWNSQIVWWNMKEDIRQHGFIPGKGTYTAWKELIPSLRNEPFIKDFDIKGFFDNVDLNYNRKRMQEIGIPEEISEYLYRLNKSIVKLNRPENKDELDESRDRKVIWNSDGGVNPNLSKREKKILEEAPESEKAELIVELKARGYKEEIEKGVPQGAATSCGLSTLNLNSLFERMRKLTMYADDGLSFPKGGIEVKATDREAGIEEADNKSHWLKVNGKWVRPLKFLGLEYIPPDIESLTGDPPRNYPVLRGATRKGSTLEYGVKQQFWVYLEGKMDIETLRLLNPLTARSTIGEWITKKGEEFLKITPSERIEKLFESERGPLVLNKLYGGSWGEAEPTSTRLEFVEKSWCNRHWGEYLHSLGPTKTNSLRGVCQVIAMSPDTSEIEREEILRSLYDLMEVGQFHREIAWELMFKKWEPWKEENLRWRLDQVSSKEDKTLLEKARTAWKNLISIMEMTAWNSSTYATDDLLNRMKEGRSICEWAQKNETKYYKGECRKRIQGQSKISSKEEKGEQKSEEPLQSNRRAKQARQRQKLRINKELKEFQKDQTLENRVYTLSVINRDLQMQVSLLSVLINMKSDAQRKRMENLARQFNLDKQAEEWRQLREGLVR